MTTMVAKMAKYMESLDGGYASYEELAKAALEAMREPMPYMVLSVEKAEEDQGYCAAAFETMGCELAWPIMIDAAIKEYEDSLKGD